MRKHVRAAFVVTVSMAATAGCQKQSTTNNGSCEPPDCHMNPPPQNPPEPIFPDAAAIPRPTINANPPAIRPDAGQMQK